jgi:LPXTG-motif cell wall-anchored protein
MQRKAPLVSLVAAFGIAASFSVASQQSTPNDFPPARDRPASCDEFDWSEQMLREYPRVVDACQEVVMAGDSAFARLSARFVRVQSDGLVVFNVRDRRDRYVDELIIRPAAGQTAFINDRPTRFDDLRTSDAISLYASEGEYGFATVPVAANEPRAVVKAVAVLPEPLPAEESIYQRGRSVAQLEQAPRALPQTAGTAHLVILLGLVCLLGGLGLAIRRRI